MKKVLFLMMAGSSTRVEVIKEKKQFYVDDIFHKPMFLYSLETALQSELFDLILLAITDTDASLVNSYLEQFKIDRAKVKIVYGGPSRSSSVNNCIKAVEKNLNDLENTVVVIHDACRPFVTKEHFEQIVVGLMTSKSISFALKVSDTMIERYPFIQLVDRNNYLRIQTPQGFHFDVLKESYETYSKLDNTDEMQIVYKLTKKFPTIRGSLTLFKVTFDDDFALYLSNLKSKYYEELYERKEEK